MKYIEVFVTKFFITFIVSLLIFVIADLVITLPFRGITLIVFISGLSLTEGIIEVLKLKRKLNK